MSWPHVLQLGGWRYRQEWVSGWGWCEVWVESVISSLWVNKSSGVPPHHLLYLSLLPLKQWCAKYGFLLCHSQVFWSTKLGFWWRISSLENKKTNVTGMKWLIFWKAISVINLSSPLPSSSSSWHVSTSFDGIPNFPSLSFPSHPPPIRSSSIPSRPWSGNLGECLKSLNDVGEFKFVLRKKTYFLIGFCHEKTIRFRLSTHTWKCLIGKVICQTFVVSEGIFKKLTQAEIHDSTWALISDHHNVTVEFVWNARYIY